MAIEASTVTTVTNTEFVMNVRIGARWNAAK